MAAPVPESERLPGLDILRGFAVLGILVMNVGMFARPYAAYFNPYAFGPPSDADLAVWSITHVLADQKFMTIFSMLFGAGVLLMTARGGERGPARLHYRRMAWLLVFGLIHAYLLWHGDILVLYAVCGLLIYPFRSFGARALTAAGLGMLVVGSGILLSGGLTMDRWPAEAVDEWRQSWNPPPEDHAAEIAAFQGGWLEQQRLRVSYAAEAHSQDILFWGLWRAGGLMLLGMALFKTGILPGALSLRAHVIQAAVGFGLGLPLVLWGLAQHHATGWNVRDSFFIVSLWNYWGSILMALGWSGLVLSLWKAGLFPVLMARLAAVGRMAFSCYILETLIATLTFYGHGLGLFGTVDRPRQMLFTAAVWAFLVLAAPSWLARFRYGPLEWVWRSLTYGRVEPLRRTMPPVAETAGAQMNPQ